MKIQCATDDGPTTVSVGHENCFFYAMLFGTFGHHLAALASVDTEQSFLAAVAEMAFIVLLLWILCGALLELISRFRLFCLRTSRLSSSEAPDVFRIVATEDSRIFRRIFTTAHSCRIYVMRSNPRVSAMVLGGFIPKIVVSAGFCVLANRQPQVAGVILRHEMAHIRTGDTRLYGYQFLLVVSVIAAVFMTIAGGVGEHWGTVLLGLLNLLYLAFVFRELLCRREFIADAIALNHTESVDEYEKVLLQPSVIHGGRYHPGTGARVRAIREDSPILRTSVPLVIVSILLFFSGILATASYLERVESIEDRTRNQRMLELGLVISAVFPAITIVGELRKGSQRANPLPETSSSAEVRATDLPRGTTGLWVIVAFSLLNCLVSSLDLQEAMFADNPHWTNILFLAFSSFIWLSIALAILSRRPIGRILTIIWCAALLTVRSYSIVPEFRAGGWHMFTMYTWIVLLLPIAVFSAIPVYMSRKAVGQLFRQVRSARFINITL